MTTTSAEPATRITPFGCALADVLRERKNEQGRPTNWCIEHSGLDADWFPAADEGRLTPSDSAEIETLSQALGLDPGQPFQEATERAVPAIVCPAWCVYDDYAGDSTVVHLSEDNSQGGSPTSGVSMTTSMDGTFIDASIHFRGDSYTWDETTKLIPVLTAGLQVL